MKLEEVPFKPYYQDESVTIYNADCRQVLPFLPKFDLLLTIERAERVAGRAYAVELADMFNGMTKEFIEGFCEVLLEKMPVKPEYTLAEQVCQYIDRPGVLLKIPQPHRMNLSKLLSGDEA